MLINKCEACRLAKKTIPYLLQLDENMEAQARNEDGVKYARYFLAMFMKVSLGINYDEDRYKRLLQEAAMDQCAIGLLSTENSYLENLRLSCSIATGNSRFWLL